MSFWPFLFLNFKATALIYAHTYKNSSENALRKHLQIDSNEVWRSVPAEGIFRTKRASGGAENSYAADTGGGSASGSCCSCTQGTYKIISVVLAPLKPYKHRLVGMSVCVSNK